MKSRILALCSLVVLAGASQALAHHSFSATYDAGQKIEIEGVVKEFVWRKDRKSTRLNSSHVSESRMPSSA